MRLLKSIKIRLYNYYYSIFPIVEIPVDDLIFPHREDINLRVDFIKNYILKPSNIVENSPYYEFLLNLKKHPYYVENLDIDKLVHSFYSLYSSIKKNGYQPDKYGHITVEKVNSKIKFVYPNKGNLVEGMDVENKYFLREGAHRLAVLKALNFNSVKCKRIYKASTSSSDYTSFIKSYRYDKKN